MPPVQKIQREDIIQAALSIVRESGFDNIQARTLAKRLNCSTQPIFYQFSNMDEIKKEVLQEALKIYKQYMLAIEDKTRPYRSMGMNYLKFAKEESSIFQLVFMNDFHSPVENFMMNDKSYEEIHDNIKIQTGLQDEYIKDFHLKMWVFTHGIACLIATNTCDFTESQIDQLMTEEFCSLMALEKEKGHVKGVCN